MVCLKRNNFFLKKLLIFTKTCSKFYFMFVFKYEKFSELFSFYKTIFPRNFSTLKSKKEIYVMYITSIPYRSIVKNKKLINFF